MYNLSQMGSGSSQGPAGNSYQQAIANAMAARAARAPVDSRNTIYDPDPDPGMEDAAASATSNPNVDVGAGSGVPTQQAGGAISGLASGLAAAAQTYANSIKPWQVQKNNIPDPDEFKRQQQIQFGQVGT
jgi:hypothetical protein